MQHLPLLISLGSLLIWALVILFLGGRIRLGALGIGLGLSLVQLGCAIWESVKLFAAPGGVQWSGAWFQIGANEAFELKFAIDMPTMLVWLLLSTILLASAYFVLLNEARQERDLSRGEKTALPLLGLAALLTLTAGNITVFYFGWSMIAAVGFLAAALSFTLSDKRALASFRYILLNTIPEVVVIAGIMGIYSELGNLDFETINLRATNGLLPAWPVVCLVIGVMLRNMQIPFMQNVRHLASAGSMALPVFFVGHALLTAIIFTKLYPAITSTSGIQYYCIIPALTALTAAVMTLPERDPVALVGWLVSYLAASVFLSGLVGHYQAVHALMIAGTLGAFTLAMLITQCKPGQRGAHWAVGAVVLLMTGLPGFGWGWARYLEYVGLAGQDPDSVPLPGIILGIKVLADVILSLGLWAVAKDYWIARPNAREAQPVRWDSLVPVIVLLLLGISAAMGGRPLGGMGGAAELEIFPGSGWFERLVTVPAGAGGLNALDALGSDADIIARVLLFAVLFVPAALGLTWLFRDQQKLEEFRAFFKRSLEKVTYRKNDSTLLWDFLIRPINEGLGKAAAYLDARIIDYFLSDRWTGPVRRVRGWIRTVEHKVLDEKIVDGSADAIAGLGKALRLLQNGHVQFYFALGLILMGVILARFTGLGG